EHSHFDGTCNPTFPQHWFKAFLDSDADIYQQSYTIEDNPFLPAAFVENLKKEYAGTVYYDRFIRGLWVAAEGAIYTQFIEHKDRFIVEDVPRDATGNPAIKFAVIGVDFGGNGSANAFICNGILPGYKGVVTLDEHYQKGIIAPAKLEADFIDFVLRCKAQGYKIYEAYCDSAEQTLIEGLRTACRKARLNIDIKNARKGTITERIRFYLMMMGLSRYTVLRRCTHLIEAFSSAVWDAKHVTDDVRLDDGKHNIDSLDALEYSTESLMADIITLR
ncbi:MAG: PBSX family phage terminase large subunit, partial [Ruthenibacterium sp.]